MHTATLEEQFTFAEIEKKIARLPPKLGDVTGERLTFMDANGVSVQVLSVAGMGTNLIKGGKGVELAAKDEIEMIAHGNADKLLKLAVAHEQKPA